MRPRLSESSREPLDEIGNQDVRLVDAVFGIIDEGRLNTGPPRTQLREIVAGKKLFVG
jgi:hypothetical protein